MTSKEMKTLEINDTIYEIVDAKAREQLANGGGAGTQVQSDYAQNDSTAADYIKNRPFYMTTGATLFDADVTTALDEDGNISYRHPAAVFDFDTMNEGDTFEVTFNGASYLCVINVSLFPFIGNFYIQLEQSAAAAGMTTEECIAEMVQFMPELAALAVDTGEPFCIMDDMEVTRFITREAGTYHFKITPVTSEVDSGFKSLLQADYAQNDPTAANYIKNRPFYSGVETLYDGDIITTKDDDSDPYAQAVSMKSMLLKVGDVVDIVFDGVEYSLTCELLGDDMLYIGNQNIMMGTYHDSELPFFIMFADVGTAFYTVEARTYSVNMTTTVIQKFSSKYIEWEGDSTGVGLPEVTTADNDKILMVVDGVWTVSSITDGDEVAY